MSPQSNREAVLEQLEEMKSEAVTGEGPYWEGYRTAVQHLIDYVENS